MKKTLLLIAAVLMGMTLAAQNLDIFEFVDKDGNVVPNESLLTFTEVTSEEDFLTGELTNTMYTHLKLRNKTGENQAMRVNVLIERIDNGAYQICFPMACKSYEEVTNVITEGGTFAPNELKDLQTEWIPTDLGGCDVTLTVELLAQMGTAYIYMGDGPTVTLRFRNGIVDDVTGDVTGDGKVDIADVNAVINVMLGKAEQTDVADVTGEGKVDIADVNAVINLMLGK